MATIADNLQLDLECLIIGHTTAGGSNSINTVQTLHYRRQAIVNPLSLSNFATACLAVIQAPILAALNNRWTWDRFFVRVLNDATDPGISVAVGLPGGVAGDGMTSVNAAFLYIKSALRGKSYRGGIHLGPLSEADTTGAPVDLFNAAAIIRLNAVATALLTVVTDASPNSYRLEIVSRKYSKTTKNPTLVIANQATTVLLNTRVGRLKRREAKSVY